MVGGLASLEELHRSVLSASEAFVWDFSPSYSRSFLPYFILLYYYYFCVCIFLLFRPCCFQVWDTHLLHGNRKGIASILIAAVVNQFLILCFNFVYLVVVVINFFDFVLVVQCLQPAKQVTC